MKRYVLALALAALSTSALATNYKTCPDGSKIPSHKTCPEPPKPEPPVTPTPTPVEIGINQGQSQQQQQGQGQSQNATSGSLSGAASNASSGSISGANATGGSSTSTNLNANTAAGGHSSAQTGDQTLTLGNVGSTSGASSSAAGGAGGSVGDTISSSGGNTLSNGSESASSASNGDQTLASSNAASADGSGNSTVNVDSADRSVHQYTSQALGLAPIMTAAPTIIPGAAASVVYGQCGPIMAKETSQVEGVYFGLIRKHRVVLGHNDRIVEHSGALFKETVIDGRLALVGQRAVRTVAVLTVSGSRQLGIGGGNTGGGWGQGGTSGGSSMQQVVQQIDFEPCIAYMQEAPGLPLIEFSEPRIPRG